MDNHDDRLMKRRRFIQLAGAGLIAVPLGACSGGDDAPAASSGTASTAPPAPPAETPPAAEPPPAAQPAPPPAQTASGERLSEDDPVAQSLGYKHNAEEVDLEKFPQRGEPQAANQFCSNCVLYQGGDAEWGGCSIFGTKQVNANGWCATWAPRAS